MRRGEADSFKQLRKQALALGVSNREVNMAADEGARDSASRGCADIAQLT